MNSTLSLYLGQSLRMISSSGPQRRLSQKPGTANSTSVGLPAAIASAIVEVCISGEGLADESMIERSLTSFAVRLRLLGAGEPIGGVNARSSTLKGDRIVFLTLGLDELTSICKPQSPARSKATAAV